MPHTTKTPRPVARFLRRLSTARVAFALIAAAIVAALIASFCYGPPFTMARFQNDNAPANPTSAQHWLNVLGDNNRSPQHADAALALLRLNDRSVIAPLCDIAERKTLNSQLIVIALLGTLQDDAALPTLRRLFYSGSTDVAAAAITAVTVIDSPAAESLLISHLRDPIHGRAALPLIAAVGTPSACRVLSLTIQNGPLAAHALRQITSNRLADCTDTILSMARDTSGDVAFRLLCLEALAELATPEAQLALRQLQTDSRIGWKAARLLQTAATPETPSADFQEGS